MRITGIGLTLIPQIIVQIVWNFQKKCLYLQTDCDDTTKTVDIGDFIRRHPHPQYNKYLDPRKFSRFTIENGNIVWGKNWDLMFPVEQLYTGEVA